MNRVRADLFSRADRYEEAVKELKAILAIAPDSAEAHALLGIAYRGVGSAELLGEAVAEFRQALTLDPGLVPARFYLAHIYLELGRASRARDELQQGLAQAPRNPQFMASLGEAERQLGNARRSVELNRQALALDESFAQSRYYLGLALLDLGQREEAVKELERVVSSGPTVVDPYLTLGALYLETARVDRALDVLQQGMRLDPARPGLRVQLARAFRLKGLLDNADEQLGLAATKTTASLASPFIQDQDVERDLYLEQGLLRSQQGRLEAAVEAFEKVLAMEPKHAVATRSVAAVRKRLQAKAGTGK